ncbi:hypothetical protein NDU88_000472 [Pleurodeles waltl]|uniref:Uncharacterized protein n=1 Tax=Pleurodeles waltl TaxID=8319 RepID=A0AAV7KTJ5_PLEWA|nr:hypothetical protein NDU88_000472 [Pleurodeles waltl]
MSSEIASAVVNLRVSASFSEGRGRFEKHKSPERANEGEVKAARLQEVHGGTEVVEQVLVRRVSTFGLLGIPILSERQSRQKPSLRERT